MEMRDLWECSTCKVIKTRKCKGYSAAFFVSPCHQSKQLASNRNQGSKYQIVTFYNEGTKQVNAKKFLYFSPSLETYACGLTAFLFWNRNATTEKREFPKRMRNEERHINRWAQSYKLSALILSPLQCPAAHDAACRRSVKIMR